MIDLYPDAYDPMGLNIGGDEFPRHPFPIRLLPPLSADEIKRLTGPLSPPRPTVTAWQGAPLDAYWLDGDLATGVWRHCQTGEVWHA